MKYDQQVREAFIECFREAFELGLGDSKADFPEELFEDTLQEIIQDMGGYERIDREIDQGVQKGHSVEEQLATLKKLLNRIKIIEGSPL